MDNNLSIYEKVRSVPDSAQKGFNNGSFSGTDINPMWRIKTLTEQFGPCGIGWYYEVISERSETYGNTVMAIVDINLYIKVDGEWSKPIFGTGGNTLVKETKSGLRPSDEGYKMALTDALSVACKALGIGADVYWDRDSTKYTKGSADNAQAVGEAKLEQITEQMRKVSDLATADQIAFIKANASDAMYEQAMTHFGLDLERMTAVQADKMIKRIKEGKS